MTENRQRLQPVFACVLALAMLGVSACGARREPAPALAPEAPVRARTAALRGPLAAQLDHLPSVATFAWVVPSEVFRGVRPQDDSLAATAQFAALRASGEDVLRAHGWREVPSDSAQFRLALVVQDSTAQQVVAVTPDPRSTREPEVVCTGAKGRNLRERCREVPPPRYPPRQTIAQHTVRRIGYAIVRTSDGASRWWILRERSGAETAQHIKQWTLGLLLAKAQ